MPEILNINPMIVWVVAATQVLTFGLTVWNMLTSASRVNAKRIDEHHVRLEEHGNRLNGLEVAQRGLPTKDEMHALEIAMERLKGQLNTVTQAMAGHAAIMERLESVVARHENHLLDGVRK